MTTILARRFGSTAELDAALIERLQLAISGPDAGGTAVMLSGGRTPLPAYRELAARKPRAVSGLTVLYSDDRYVPATSESSNYYQSRTLIEALALPQSSVLRVRTELPSNRPRPTMRREFASSCSRVSGSVWDCSASARTGTQPHCSTACTWLRRAATWLSLYNGPTGCRGSL